MNTNDIVNIWFVSRGSRSSVKCEWLGIKTKIPATVPFSANSIPLILQCKALRTIELSGLSRNGLRKSVAQTSVLLNELVPRLVNSCTSLHSLSLRALKGHHIILSPNCVSAIAKMSSLTSLTLCRVGTTSSSDLSPLTRLATSLTRLELSGGGGLGGTDGASLLWISKLVKLKALQIRGSDISDANAVTLLQPLRHLESLSVDGRIKGNESEWKKLTPLDRVTRLDISHTCVYYDLERDRPIFLLSLFPRLRMLKVDPDCVELLKSILRAEVFVVGGRRQYLMDL